VRSLTPAQLLLVAIILLVPLLNLVVRWLQRRMQGVQPAAPAPEALGPPAHLPPRARRLEPVLPAEGVLGAALPPPPGRRPRRLARLGGLPEIRRAVVTMTILGPCRALEEPTPAGPARQPLESPPRRGG